MGKYVVKPFKKSQFGNWTFLYVFMIIESACVMTSLINYQVSPLCWLLDLEW